MMIRDPLLRPLPLPLLVGLLFSTPVHAEDCLLPSGPPDVRTCMTDPNDWAAVSCRALCREAFCVGVTVVPTTSSAPPSACLYVTDLQGRMTGNVDLGFVSQGFSRFGLEATDAGEIAVTTRVDDPRGVDRFVRTRAGTLESVRGPKPPLSEASPPAPPREPVGQCSFAYGRLEGCQGPPAPASFLQEAARACGWTGPLPTPPPAPTEDEAEREEAREKAPAGPRAICSAGTCLAAIPTREADARRGDGEERRYCLWARARGGAGHELDPQVVLDPTERSRGFGLRTLDLTGTRLCLYLDQDCSYGACSASGCLTLGVPDRMGALDPKPQRAFEVSANVIALPRAPVLDGELSRDPAWARTERLQSDTSPHVLNGLGAWEGPQDASVVWRWGHTPDAVYLGAEVRDAHVTPATAGLDPLFADHLELRPLYAIVLRPQGVAEVRQWGAWKSDGSLERKDEPVAETRCRWKARPGGYGLECRLPFKTVTGFSPPPSGGAWRLVLSDGDGEPRQKSVLGSDARLLLWKEFPPSVKEHTAVMRDLR